MTVVFRLFDVYEVLILAIYYEIPALNILWRSVFRYFTLIFARICFTKIVKDKEKTTVLGTIQIIIRFQLKIKHFL